MINFRQHPPDPGLSQQLFSSSPSLCFSPILGFSSPDDFLSSDSESEQIGLPGQTSRRNSLDQGVLAFPPSVAFLALIEVTAIRPRERLAVMSKPASRDYEVDFAPLRRYEQLLSKSCE